MRKWVAAAGLCACAAAFELPAAEAEPTARPRIALVLSGGGARGLAHIGVLKVLRDARVPIEYIVATSMGSIVGGAYAAGRTPEELEALVQSAVGSYRGTITVPAAPGAVGITFTAVASLSVDDPFLYLPSPACLPQGTQYLWIEPQNADGVPGPVAGPYPIIID